MIGERGMSAALRIAPTRKRDVRTQFGAICWRMRQDRLRLCLVTTRTTRRWMVPKGWPISGATPAQAAATEAFEEAGVEGRMDDRCVGFFPYTKVMDDGPALPCIVALFPLRVDRVHDDWPEAAERERRWVSPRKASQLVALPELAVLLRDFVPPCTSR